MNSFVAFRNRMWRDTISIITIASLLNMCLVPCSAQNQTESSLSSPQARKERPWLKYTGLRTKDASDSNFTTMLQTMSEEERIQLAIAFRMFPSLKKSDFGNYGLKKYEDYADRKEHVSAQRPLRPRTFNEVGPDVIRQAFEAGRLSPADYIAPGVLKKQLIWVSSSTIMYPFKSDLVDYHSLVQWVARKKGVPKEQVQALPTFELEKKIVEKYFEDLWDRLTPEQRKELLDALEKELGQTIPNKGAMVLMSGGAAIAALGVTVGLTGFAFYTTMSVMIYTIGAILGITFPFAVYTSASSVVAVLAGPVGWILAGGAILGGIVWAQLPSVDKTASFIMALHFLKAEAFHEAGLL
jgi:hypothetical protein